VKNRRELIDAAFAITVFIQPCIGQGFCPLAPQSNVFGPAAALPESRLSR